MVAIAHHAIRVDFVPTQYLEGLITQLVNPDGANQNRIGTESGGVTCEICRRAAEPRGVRVNVPQHFADRGDYRPLPHAATPSLL
jgi:hypothetical protein